jgi:hypothetical protein
VTKSKKISEEHLYAHILEMCRDAGPESHVRPEDVAMSLTDDNWQGLLKRIRIAAKKLAQGGAVVILRKGKPTDPEDFKGVYRLRIATADNRYMNE